MINNAGICVCGEFEWQTWRQVENQINVNVLGTLRVTKAFLQLLKSSDHGKYKAVTDLETRMDYFALPERSCENLNFSAHLSYVWIMSFGHVEC